MTASFHGHSMVYIRKVNVANLSLCLEVSYDAKIQDELIPSSAMSNLLCVFKSGIVL